jgi:hypothetical protein
MCIKFQHEIPNNEVAVKKIKFLIDRFLHHAKPRRFYREFLATPQGFKQHEFLGRGTSFGAGQFLGAPTLSGSFLRCWSRHRIRRFHFTFTPGRLGAGQTMKPVRLQKAINSSTTKPLVGLMLCNIVSANQLVSSFLNTCCELDTKLLLPDSGVNLRHQHGYLGEWRFLHLHQKTKTMTKRLQAPGEKLLHHIATTDERGSLHKSYEVNTFKVTR